jgi:hypothetical protein
LQGFLRVSAGTRTPDRLYHNQEPTPRQPRSRLRTNAVTTRRSRQSSEVIEKLDRYRTVGPIIALGSLSEERPCFPDLSCIAGAGFEHLSPTLAYRFVKLIELP